MGEKGFSFSGYERDPLFLNLGGKKVLDISGVSGVDSISDGRAGVFADFDNDGDTDIFMNTIQGDAHILFRNNVGAAAGWVRVSLEGNAKIGPAAWGAQVRVKTPVGVQTKLKSCGEGFLSQHDPRLLFGLPQDGAAEWIEVCWPGGAVDRFTGPFKAGSEVLLRPAAKEAQIISSKRTCLADPPSASDHALRRLKLRQGAQVPDLAISDSAGKATTLRAGLRPGRKMLLNLWATWCTNCAVEMPLLSKMAPALTAKGIDLCGLSLDTTAGVDIAAWAQTKQVTYPLFLGGTNAAAALYASPQITVPVTILIDANGIVLQAWNGWSAEVEAAISALTR